jgi:hypothetical protein
VRFCAASSVNRVGEPANTSAVFSSPNVSSSAVNRSHETVRKRVAQV